MGIVTTEYRASANLTITSLNSLAASAGLLAGWSSGTIDNTTDKDLDKAISAKFSSAAAGSIQVYAYSMLDDTNWPDIFSAGTEGTEGTATIHDDEQKASALIPLWSTTTDGAPNPDPHSMLSTSIRKAFGGFMPPKFALFITASGALAATGNQVTVKGTWENIA